MTRPSERARQSRKRMVKHAAAVCSLMVFAIAVFTTVTVWRAHDDNQTSTGTGRPHDQEVNASTGRIESRILFMGDMFWGRAVNRWAQASALKEAYPFSRLNEFNRGVYDAWIANLECPSVPGVNQPYTLETQSLLFNCPSTYMPEAAKWFTAVSLANNHMANQGGQAGTEATRKVLSEQGIQYFGHYDPAILADVCEVISLPARLKQDKGSDKAIRLPVALCGYHGLAAVPSAASLAIMKNYSKYMPVIAYPHMGVEYSAAPTTGQQSLYRAMIDNGADAVLASHPHWVQPAEAYKGKLIVYSMGNFMFDQGPGETQRGAAIDLSLTTGNVAIDDLAAWSTVGKHCSSFHDDCLTRVIRGNLRRLPWKFTYAARGVDMSDRITHPADAELTNIILQRLDWATVQKQLSW